MGIQVVNGKPDNSGNRETAPLVLSLLKQHAVFGIAFRGGAGCGKTSLIEATIKQLGEVVNCAVICGDPTGSFDAERLSALGIQAVQVLTNSEHYLSADMVLEALGLLDLSQVDLLFVEDCGNVNLAGDSPLGMHRNVSCLSSCQGEFAIKKYSDQFTGSDVNLVTKADLAQAIGFSAPLAVSSLKRINPDSKVIVTSARDGDGVDSYCDCIRREMEKQTCEI